MISKRLTISSAMLAAIAVSIVLLCSCHHHNNIEMSDQVIVENETFTLTGDSIIEGDIVVCAPNRNCFESNLDISLLNDKYSNLDTARVKFVEGEAWQMSKKRPPGIPEYNSNQPLVDAIYNMSIDRIEQAVDSNGQFDALHNYSRLYCAIYLSLAHIKPQQSMETLRAVVDHDSIIMQLEGQWPVESDHIGWATAAWEVYKATGDREWLDYSYHVIKKTLEINRRVLLDRNIGLIHGAGYTTNMPLGPRRMNWMDYNDLFSCISLGNNILTAHAYRILDDMSDELGIEENSFDEEAVKLKNAINQHLWNESRGCYSSFLYGMAFPYQSPTTDNTSQAMCVLWDIADDDRAENLIANTPVGDCGVNVTYPASTPIEPYFVNSSWASTQALWNIAAATIGNENALRRGLGALYRAQAMYQSRGIHLQDLDIDELGTGASNVAMVLRVLMGMNFTPEGIEFSPTVPVGMSGIKTFTGFKYRQAVINVSIEGNGNDVASIIDNGKKLEGAFLPNTAKGVHNIVIILTEKSSDNQKVTIHHNDIIMPPTPLVAWENDSGRIMNYVDGMSYRLSINGRLSVLRDSIFAIPINNGFAELSVGATGMYVNSFMSKPLLRFNVPPQIVSIPNDNISHLAFNVNVDEGGDYMIDVAYRPTGTLDVRELSINTHPMGTLVMTQIKQPANKSDELAYSNMVTIRLLKGKNKVELNQILLPKAFTPCKTIHMRIIKR